MRPATEPTIASFLDALAARVPAPGGGAVAALCAAQSAALLSMVAHYSDGSTHAVHAPTIAELLAETETSGHRALELVVEDADAFSAVSVAYRMPRDSAEEQAVRTAAIQQALACAAEPPAAVLALASRLIALADRLAPIANRNVVTDIAAAADMAAAAASIARLNVEINLAGLRDASVRQPFVDRLAGLDQEIDLARAITEAVRAEITQ